MYEEIEAELGIQIPCALKYSDPLGIHAALLISDKTGEVLVQKQCHMDKRDTRCMPSKNYYIISCDNGIKLRISCVAPLHCFLCDSVALAYVEIAKYAQHAHTSYRRNSATSFEK